MSSQSHVSHCRVLPLGEFTVTIPEPHVTLQGAVTWRNQGHDRATLQGVRIPSAILKIVFRHILFFFVFNAVWALTSGGFRIVSDTLVLNNYGNTLLSRGSDISRVYSRPSIQVPSAEEILNLAHCVFPYIRPETIEKLLS